MSDEATTAAAEAPVKKKSKLPIILVLVLLVGGGGFFVMKMRGGRAKVEIKLSKEKPAELKEFLVNLQDPGVYCRTEIALGLADTAKPTLIDEHEDAVRDAINLRLCSKHLKDVSTPGGLEELKREIATDLNKVLAEPKDDKKPDDANPDEPAKPEGAVPGKKATKPGDSADASDQAAVAPQHPEWDSDTGPVLKVYFSSFATQ